MGFSSEQNRSGDDAMYTNLRRVRIEVRKSQVTVEKVSGQARQCAGKRKRQRRSRLEGRTGHERQEQPLARLLPPNCHFLVS